MLELPAAGSPAPRTELSGAAVARLLLIAGAVLMVIAAAAFTVANWSSIGPLGRAAVLLGVSAVMLGVPVPLTRRGLAATAESVAAVGLALTIGDAYLIARLLHLTPGAGSFGIAAGTTVLTGAWAAYGRVSRLRGPWLAAIGLAQFAGLYLIDGLVHELGGPLAPAAGPIAVGLVLLAGADLFLGTRLDERGRRAEAVMSSLLGGTAWIAGITLAGLVVVAGPDLARAAWSAAAFAGAAVVGLVIWPGNSPLAPVVLLVSPLSGMVLAGVAAPIAVVVPGGWGVVAYGGVSGAVIAAVWLLGGLRKEVRPGIRLDLAAAGSVIVLAITVLYVLPSVLLALFQPYPVTSAWTGRVQAGSLIGATASTAGWPALIVLAVAGVACWLVQDWHRSGFRSGLIAVVAGAVASLPVALNLGAASGWARLGILTAGVAGLTAGAVARDAQPEAGRPQAAHVAAALAAIVLAVSALGWSLTGPATTIAELAALTIIFTAGAVVARPAFTAIGLTGAALACAAGLGFAAPLAAGWPATQAALVVVAVAVLAILAATKAKPVQGLVLDVGAGVAVLAAAATAASRADSFALVAALAALTASATAWLRTGQRRSVALTATGVAIVAAVAAQLRPLAGAWFRPVSQAWHGHPLLGGGTGNGLAFAAAVLTICLAAGIAAAGAAQPGRQSSLDALAIALPVITVPATLASGLSYPLVFAALLLLALALTAWAALRPSLAPAGGATVATLLALDWALASRPATLIALGCLAAIYVLCAWKSTRRNGRAATASLAELAAAGALAAAVLAGGLPGWGARPRRAWCRGGRAAHRGAAGRHPAARARDRTGSLVHRHRRDRRLSASPGHRQRRDRDLRPAQRRHGVAPRPAAGPVGRARATRDRLVRLARLGRRRHHRGLHDPGRSHPDRVRLAGGAQAAGAKLLAGLRTRAGACGTAEPGRRLAGPGLDQAGAARGRRGRRDARRRQAQVAGTAADGRCRRRARRWPSAGAGNPQADRGTARLGSHRTDRRGAALDRRDLRGAAA